MVDTVKLMDFIFIPLSVIYIVLVILNMKKKLSLSNIFASIFCISTLPFYIYSCIYGFMFLLSKSAWGIMSIAVLVLPLTVVILFIFLKINIFPTDKISPKLEKFSPNERKIIGARRLTICGLIGLAIYIIPFMISLKWFYLSIIHYHVLFYPMSILIGMVFLPIYLMFIYLVLGIPAIAFVFSSLALLIVYVVLLNGCIRNSILLGKSKKQKALIIFMSLCTGFNIILAIYFLFKSIKALKNAKQSAPKEKQALLS